MVWHEPQRRPIMVTASAAAVADAVGVVDCSGAGSPPPDAPPAVSPAAYPAISVCFSESVSFAPGWMSVYWKGGISPSSDPSDFVRAGRP